MRGNGVGVNMKIYFAHGWQDEERIECKNGWEESKNHPTHVKKCDILIFKLNYDFPLGERRTKTNIAKHKEGEISKGILNEIIAAQEARIPVYLWKDGKLTDDPAVLSKLKLRKWKRKFKDVEHPFRKEK